ncbi:MAG: prefoldin domain-containing protein [Thermodesulfobacteriaceae bacterium]|nr:prefoldin domain-containing protein [Thermodesulfobacteriaceae bacterium]
MKVKKGLKFLVPALAGIFCFAKVSLAESPEELKAQIEALKKQMSTMQSQLDELQKKLKEVQTTTETLSPKILPKDSKPVFGKPGFEWQLYGRVKVDYHYDTARMDFYNDFIGAVVNRWANATHKKTNYQNDSTNFNPRDTRLGAIVYSKVGNWMIKGQTEIDFYGTFEANNIIPRIRLAFADVTNTRTKTSILFGQDWIPVSQLNPSTVDFGILTAAGNLWWRVPQITVRQKVGDCWELLGSLMMHRRRSTASEERMPWVLARIEYRDGVLGKLFDKGSRVALGGGYKHGQHNSTIDDVDFWLLAGEWLFNFKLANQKMQFKGEAWMGQGIGEEFLRYDLGVNPRTRKPIRGWGAWADLVWFINPKWSLALGAGIDNPNDSNILERLHANPAIAPRLLGDRQFTQNVHYFINVWYSLTKDMRIGAEWVHVETERKKWTDTANRFTLSAFYSF